MNVRIEIFDGSHNPLVDHVIQPVSGLESRVYLPTFDNRNAATPAYMVISVSPISVPPISGWHDADVLCHGPFQGHAHMHLYRADGTTIHPERDDDD